MEAEGWEFIPCNRRWDAGERETISLATGLYELSVEYGADLSDKWWKQYAEAYRKCRDPRSALVAASAIEVRQL